MRLRSDVHQDLDQAWERSRASARRSGIPDSFPIEVTNRLRTLGHSPTDAIGQLFAPGTPVAILAPKESGTLRPFTVLAPRDQVFFQALADRCIPAIAAVLPEDGVVFQYRPQIDGPQTFRDTLTWRDFSDHTRQVVSDRGGYVLEADIAGFFLHVRTASVIKGLLAIGAPPDVCADLEVLLTHFELHGVPGLPQGQDASTAISNVVLKPLDDWLRFEGITYSRWSDDLRVFASTYTAAQRAQEGIERHLLADGFTLAAGKTVIRRASSALKRFQNLEQSLETIRDDKLREAIAASSGQYDLDLNVIEDLRESAEVEAVEALYHETVQPISAGRWSSDPLFRTKIRFLLRLLGQVGSSVATAELLEVAWRYPDLIGSVAGYLRQLATVDPDRVSPLLPPLHVKAAFGVEYQRLAVASVATVLARNGEDARISNLVAKDAATSGANPILRRRAGMAAVSLGPRRDPSVAADLWTRFQDLPDPGLSKLYLIVGASYLSAPARGSLFANWSGESRAIDALIEVVQGGYHFDLSEV